MKRRRRNRPVVEGLEGRRLLSVAAAPAEHAAAHVAGWVAHRHLAPVGTIQGTWSREFTNPDIGGAQTLQGTGTVRPLGMAVASGTLHMPGFVAMGHTTGTLILESPLGSVALELVGTTTQPGFSAPAASLRFRIVKGTGRFAGASGSGTAELQERPEQGPSPGPPGTFTPHFLIAPSFTLTLHA